MQNKTVKLLLLSVASIFGCTPSREVESASAIVENSSTSTPPLVLDAGIIFDGKQSYRCVPLDAIGLEKNADVVSVSTSCDCVMAVVVSYQDPSKQIRKAILLEFINDAQQEELFTPVKLDVAVHVQLRSGSRNEFTVRIIRTHTSDG